MKSIKDEIAIVTGASRGVGKAVSLKLAEQGCHVAVVARTESELAELAGEISEKGVQALPIVADVSQEEDVKKVVEQTLAKFGRVDILVNNAGIGRYGSLEELTVKDYDDMMNTNMRSTFLCSKFILPEMKKQSKGHILNLASVAGLKGLPNESIYCATKFAQVGFAQALDYEARPYGVKVSSICPGGINTTFAFGTGRVAGDPRFENFLSADEIADVVLFVLKQPDQARIIQVAMRPMSEPL